MVKIFFSYDHKDEELREELEKQLSLLKWEGLITDWHDRMIVAGQKWAVEIDKHLNTADIILLLVSPDFIASNYCYGVEVRRAMERHERGEAVVIPIILRSVYWQPAPFGKLQVLPKDAKPVKSWPDLDEAFLNVAQGIRTAIEELTKQKNERTKEFPDLPIVPVIAIMGTSGGVGKGTFVSCTSQLIADGGHDVAMLDFDLESCGTTRAAEEQFGKNNPHVKTVFDQLAPHSSGFSNHQGSQRLELWDITPEYLRERKRGNILLLPAAELDSFESGWEIAANIPLPREEKLRELTREILNRVQSEHPSVQCVLIDCGAGTNPIFSAAFACADYGYIVTRPQAKYFDTIPKIRKLHSLRYPQADLQRIFTVVNGYTSQADIDRCEVLHPAGYIPDNPQLRKDVYQYGSVDYDLGYSDVFLAILKCLPASLNKYRQLVPPEDFRVKLWWRSFVDDRLAERTLRSPVFRMKTILAWSSTLILSIALIVSGVTLASWFFTQVVNTLSIVLWVVCIFLLPVSLAWLALQEKRRKLLARVSEFRPNKELEQRKFLDEILEKTDRSSLRWLKQLLDAAQKKKVHRKQPPLVAKG